MKLIFTSARKYFLLIAFLVIVGFFQYASAQVCLNSANTIYGLTNTGNLYPITVNTANVGTALVSSYSGNSPSSSNGLGYNPVNGKFYYFKRDPGGSSGEFVSFDPLSKVVSVLASCPGSYTVHTGCVTFDGSGYYTLDVNANMYLYNIATNTWKLITSVFYDQFGANINSIMTARSAGDIAIDGAGCLWILSSSSSDYGLYKIKGPLPVNAVASITAIQLVAPTTPTPGGTSFAGIAFNSTGQILMSTLSSDNKLYRMEDNRSLTLLGTFNVDGIGNDLTSCNFPVSVLPITWQSFTAELKNDQSVQLSWTVVQQTDSKGYNIEYSQDGLNWEKIAFVNSSAKNDVSVKYAYTHNKPVNGKNYYRIQQVDINGRSTYSSIKTVSIQSSLKVNIGPNPARDYVRIQNEITHGRYPSKAWFFDQSGRLVKENVLQAGMNIIDISQMPLGTYMVRIQLANGEIISQKCIKL